MTTSFVLVLPEQELAVLQSAARQSPQFAHLLKQLPGFNAALSAPLPDHLAFIAQQAYSAASEVQANTNYPENWDELRDTCRNLRKQYNKLQAKQQLAQAQPVVPVEGGCPSCGSHRKVLVNLQGCPLALHPPSRVQRRLHLYPGRYGNPKGRQ